MDRLQTLYDEDFYAWTREQAAALDELRRRHWNGPLDLSNLAEEVADLGKAERNAVFSQAERLIEHLLKLTHSRQTRPRRGWIVTVDDARRELHKHLTPSLEAALAEALPDLYRRERKRTARKLALYGEPAAAAMLPENSPFTPAQLADDDWWPDGRG